MSSYSFFQSFSHLSQYHACVFQNTSHIHHISRLCELNCGNLCIALIYKMHAVTTFSQIHGYLSQSMITTSETQFFCRHLDTTVFPNLFHTCFNTMSTFSKLFTQCAWRTDTQLSTH